jgi:hypothetical protein
MAVFPSFNDSAPKPHSRRRQIVRFGPEDFDVLRPLLIKIVFARPGTARAADRLFFEIGRSGGNRLFTDFESYTAVCSELRNRHRPKRLPSRFQLEILMTPLADLLSRASLVFPDMSRFCDELMFVCMTEVFGEEEAKKCISEVCGRPVETAEDYHRHHEMLRKIGQIEIKGVG